MSLSSFREFVYWVSPGIAGFGIGIIVTHGTYCYITKRMLNKISNFDAEQFIQSLMSSRTSDRAGQTHKELIEQAIRVMASSELKDQANALYKLWNSQMPDDPIS